MERFKRWNNIAGWTSFAIAAVVYLLTIEPTVSYWDCGEFITCAHKFEVSHPPGAPLFLLLAKIFSLPAPNTAKVAMFINAFSALMSALTILFVFWTITHLAKKIVFKNNDISTGQIISVLGAGFVGAMAFTFSDSFWFSAVEAEVYATSSLFTALVFWAILKWEESSSETFANRWIILICYLMGLSIGVHLLNLLTIPALVLVVYFRKFKPTVLGFVVAVILSFIILGSVQIGIIQGLIKLAAKTELVFVNSFHLPYNSGVIAYGITLLILLTGGIWITYKTGKVIANTVVLALTMLILGYCSYATVLIRSQAGTPLNENRPDNMFSLLYYLDREQYGETPLFYGPYYNAPTGDLVNGEPTYTRANGKYVPVDTAQNFTFDPRFMTFFPRMHSRNQSHIRIYKDWADIKGVPLTVTVDGKQMVEYCPTFSENLAFFFKYQLGYMYFRYFMWNFSGKQNDVDGDCGILNGNWITGVNFIDNKLYGPQDKLPSRMMENKGRNRYFMLPLLLGLLGFIHLLSKSKRYTSVIFFLFFMTGIAIVLYLNQTPLQPRERDYSYVGSFYAFAIWIGLGVLALIQALEKYVSQTKASIIATAAAIIAVPAIMAFQNWDDHDRSGRYTAHDVAYNYLNSCAPNAILFTDGDNDTFPLWYLQEVEGIRTDVRVVNTTLLGSDWYIDQLKEKINKSEPIRISLTSDKYLSRRRDYVYLLPHNEDYITLKDAVQYVASDDPKTKTFPGLSFTMDYIPSKNFKLPVDTQKVIVNGTVSQKHSGSLVSEIIFTLSRNYISKSELLVMDIVSQNNWDRPIYFGSPNSDGILGFQEYLQAEGSAYQLVPIKTPKQGRFSHGSIEPDTLYHNLMEKFRWGRMNQPDVYIDNYNKSTYSFLRTRLTFARLAEALYLEGKKDSAYQALDRCIALMPGKIFDHDVYSIEFVETAYKINARKQAQTVLNEFANQCLEDIRFYYAMPLWQFKVTQGENSLAQETIQQLADIAGKYGDLKSKNELERKLKETAKSL
jgi:Dolichyl-phosphate-mannose--protein O-mannosyl transferase